MFVSTLNSADSQFSALMDLVNWQDKVRETLTAPVGVEAPIRLDRATIDVLTESLPPKKFWQTFDHCAAVGRGYSIFEDAVEKLVREYLEVLTKITPTYASLIEAVRTQHRVGIAHVMGKWGDEKSFYSSLKEVDLAGGLVDGLRGSSYAILAEAFLTDSDNYRWETLERIFRKIGFDGALTSIRDNTEVQAFQRENIDGETVSGRLNSFVKLRNEAAHGTVDTVLSANELSKDLRLLNVLLLAFAGLFRWDLTRQAALNQSAIHLGTLVKRYSNNIFGVCGKGLGTVRLGDKVLVGKKSLGYVNIIGLQIGKDSVEHINVERDFEFGIKLSTNNAEGSEIYIWK